MHHLLFSGCCCEEEEEEKSFEEDTGCWKSSFESRTVGGVRTRVLERPVLDDALPRWFCSNLSRRLNTVLVDLSIDFMCMACMTGPHPQY